MGRFILISIVVALFTALSGYLWIGKNNLWEYKLRDKVTVYVVLFAIVVALGLIALIPYAGVIVLGIVSVSILLLECMAARNGISIIGTALFLELASFSVGVLAVNPNMNNVWFKVYAYVALAAGILTIVAHFGFKLWHAILAEEAAERGETTTSTSTSSTSTATTASAEPSVLSSIASKAIAGKSTIIWAIACIILAVIVIMVFKAYIAPIF